MTDRELRESEGLSVFQVATLAGVTRDTVYKWEKFGEYPEHVRIKIRGHGKSKEIEQLERMYADTEVQLNNISNQLMILYKKVAK